MLSEVAWALEFWPNNLLLLECLLNIEFRRRTDIALILEKAE